MMCGVMFITFLVYLPSLKNGFVYWDDHVVLLENPNYRGFDWPRLKWMFTTGFMGHYQPLTWLSYAVDYTLWGMDPWGYHLTSVLLHAATAGGVYWVARFLLGRAVSRGSGEGGIGLDLGAMLAALLFALHPLRVESVAWATERRDLTSGLFFVIALATYLRGVGCPARNPARRTWMRLSLVAYALSLLGKVMGVSLPIILVLLDAYPLRRLTAFPRGWRGPAVRGVWREKWPYFALAGLAAVNAFLVQYHGPAISSLHHVPWIVRLTTASFGTAFYLYKTLVPLSLSPLYAPDSPFNPFAWYFLVSGTVVAGITMAVLLARRGWPAGPALWAAYLVMLVPVVGIVQIGPQIAADRYTYLPCLGWVLLPAAGWMAIWIRRADHWMWKVGLAASSLAGILVLVTLGWLTRRQIAVWRDTEALWNQAIRVHPHNGMAHSALANWLDRQGRLTEAMHYHRLGIRYRPELAEGYSDMGVTLAKLGRRTEALEAFRQALRINPRSPGAHNGLGVILTASNDPVEVREGVEHFREALQTRPTYTTARINLAGHYLRTGEYARAVAILEEGLRLSPFDASLADHLARLRSLPSGAGPPASP